MDLGELVRRITRADAEGRNYITCSSARDARPRLRGNLLQ